MIGNLKGDEKAEVGKIEDGGWKIAVLDPRSSILDLQFSFFPSLIQKK
jgi:hypothetical protein